jgi:hypothetical protein
LDRNNLPDVHWSTFGRHANLSISKVPLTLLMWNVRGINEPKKQQYLDWLISEQKPDIVMFNETKLTSPLYLAGYYGH